VLWSGERVLWLFRNALASRRLFRFLCLCESAGDGECEVDFGVFISSAYDEMNGNSNSDGVRGRDQSDTSSSKTTVSVFMCSIS
jgi:hypothetical protein